jgi:hypothetical protein
VRDRFDTFGIRIRLGKVKESRCSPEAHTVHSVYRAWVRRQGISPDRPYVMGLYSLYGRLTEFRPDGSEITDRYERRAAARQAQRVIVEALNDPHGGLELVDRPLSRLRSA